MDGAFDQGICVTTPMMVYHIPACSWGPALSQCKHLVYCPTIMSVYLQEQIVLRAEEVSARIYMVIMDFIAFLLTIIIHGSSAAATWAIHKRHRKYGVCTNDD